MNTSGTTTTYRSIAGEGDLPYIDCDHCIRLIYARIQHHIAEDDGNCVLCRYFRQKLGDRDGSEDDARLLLHAQVNIIHELFERRQDDEAQTLLYRVEDDCC